MFAYTFLQVLVCFLLHFICYPFVHDLAIKIILDSSFLITVVFATISCNMDPGVVRSQEDFMALVASHEPADLCAFCQIKAPKRSRHCVYCDHCVEVFDHHCPWINNCVGRRNQTPFLIFISAQMIFLLSAAYMATDWLFGHKTPTFDDYTCSTFFDQCSLLYKYPAVASFGVVQGTFIFLDVLALPFVF